MNTDKTTIDISKRTKGEWIFGKATKHPTSKKDMCLLKGHRSNGLPDVLGVAYGQTKEESEANAAFIVTACNNYERLIEALKKSLNVFRQLADAGNYPAPLMAENGGEGYGFITDLLESIEQDIKTL